jgi:ParB family chromosome partitioning protein
MTKQVTTAVVVDPDRIQHLDPRTLLVDVNIRLVTEVDRKFVDSLREHGVLQAITAVLTAEGQVRVRMGNRRTNGAIEANLKTVPVRVVADESTGDAAQIDRILAQMAENDDRADLTTADRVLVVQQLSAFGLTAAQIAKRTRRDRGDVDAALAVAKSKLAQAATVRYDFLGVLEAATIAEFEDDPETVTALVAAARTGQFDHVAQQARDARADTAAREVVAAPLREAGITVIINYSQRRATYPTFHELTHMVDPESREPLTPEAHATCPGHAAYIREEWVDDNTDEEVDEDATDRQDDEEASETDDTATGGRNVMLPVFGCLDPSHYGHAYTWTTAAPEPSPQAEPLTPEEREAAEQAAKDAASAERRDVLDSNKKWRSAETVRREFLAGLLARKKAPNGTAGFLASALAHDASVLADRRTTKYIASLFGVKAPSYGPSKEVAELIDKAPATRVQLLHLVFIFGAYEARTEITDWRNRPASTGRYLAILEAIGYKLSPVEQRAIGRRDDSGDDA